MPLEGILRPGDLVVRVEPYYGQDRRLPINAWEGFDATTGAEVREERYLGDEVSTWNGTVVAVVPHRTRHHGTCEAACLVTDRGRVAWAPGLQLTVVKPAA